MPVKKICQENRGFSLVEVIVVIGITAILSGVMLVYSRRSESQILLNLEKAKVSQNVLRAKELALTGFIKPVSLPPPCSYGFHIDYNTRVYSIFEYTPSVGCANILTDPFSISPLDAGYRETASSTLTKNIEFAAGADRLGYIVFVPPDPRVLMFDENGLATPTDSMKIYLTTKDASLSVSITVNSATGQLSF